MPHQLSLVFARALTISQFARALTISQFTRTAPERSIYYLKIGVLLANLKV